MVGPGLLGSWLDKQLTSQFFTPAGFALGILFATVLLIFYTQQFAPKAKGQPLPFEEEVSGEGSDDESLH